MGQLRVQLCSWFFFFFFGLSLPSQIILCIRFALIGLTVSGREMDDLTDVILWMKETHETTASIFLLLDLALKD